MYNLKILKGDLKQIQREPIMLVLFVLPIFISIVFRLIYTYVLPYLLNYIGMEVGVFLPYILSMALCFNPLMLGIVMGFMMLDDRDGKIIELMSITPLSKQGYIINRIFFVVLPTIIYTIYTYLIMGVYILNFIELILIAFLLGSFSATIGLLFFSLAEDKIKGLTYAKGLNILNIFVFADFFKGNEIKVISKITPTYWITEFINGDSILIVFSTILCFIIWFLGVYKIYNKNIEKNLI